MDEVLYQQVVQGNLEGIKALHCAGAGLEWTDKQGRTPLIVACLKSESFQIVKFLISLGADVNGYSSEQDPALEGTHHSVRALRLLHPVFLLPQGFRRFEDLDPQTLKPFGSRAGTPLHHAAKSGLVHVVELLLSHGANPSVRNDDCQTALDLARAMGHWSVLRLFELRICRFNCWLREVHKPSTLEAIVRKRVSRKIWAVILPSDSCNPTPLKYDLAIYSDFQATQPNSVIQLSSVHIEEPTFNVVDPALIIVNKVTKKQYTFRSENEGDNQQLQLLYNICKGISQQKNHFQAAPPLPTVPVASLPNLDNPGTSNPEDVELAMAINASIQSAIAEGVPLNDTRPVVGSSNPSSCGTSSGTATRPAVSASVQVPPPTASIPSAPPKVEEAFYGGLIHYPSIDSSPVTFTAACREGSSISCPIDLTTPSPETKTRAGEGKDVSSISSLCVICLDVPSEGACIPCGHVAGCMSCLMEIRAKKWGCPVCRAKIDQIIKLYAV